jgi:uncharacterized protein
MGVVGVGLRTSHYDTWLSGAPRQSPWVEMITENVLGRGGRPRAVVEKVRLESDLFLHGVSLSIGGPDPLDTAYLHDLRRLADAVSPRFVSDHVCFGKVGGVHGHDLWPLPLTQEALLHLVPRIEQVQEILGRPLVVENVSSYLTTRADEWAESEFLAELAAVTGCLLLVDVNNVVVSSHNHGFDAHEYLLRIPKERVAYMHVAGHSTRSSYRFDDHASVPDEEVRTLLGRAFELFGDVPCIFEWDENLPDLEGYQAEAERLSS